MIEVLSGGLYTTIQDPGRFGYRKYGVPLSGSADQYSATLANQILGNDTNCAVVEITLKGPVLKFNHAGKIVITGAEFSPKIDLKPIKMGEVVNVAKGEVLRFGHLKQGMRAYLAIRGGFASQIVLGSASYYQNITTLHKIGKGDKLYFNVKSGQISMVNARVKYKPLNYNSDRVWVEKGPEFNMLSPEVQDKLFSCSYVISGESNRMGYRLEPHPDLAAEEIITAPVLPGTVQLTPSGQLIILGRDAQTTGGYARIFQLTRQAQNLLAQKQFGSEIRFVPVQD